MRSQYKKYLMWALFGALFVLTVVVQTVVFGKPQFFGVKLSLIPVCVACVTMFCGAEDGAIYALACGTFWCFAGADGGALHIVLLTLCGAAAGYICDRLLIRRFLSSVLMSLMTLAVCQGLVFLFHCYLGQASLRAAGALPVQIGLSALSCPLFYLAARAIRKEGA